MSIRDNSNQVSAQQSILTEKKLIKANPGVKGFTQNGELILSLPSSQPVVTATPLFHQTIPFM